MKRFGLPLLLALPLILAACAPQANSDSARPPAQPASPEIATPTDDPALLPTLFPNTAGTNDMTRMDEQGAVTFAVTPLNLGTPADTLDFDVSMNTHSVDLNMDLAQLATLSTDAGLTVQASEWDATPGGHHVSGKLIFPSMQDTKSLLKGASKLTLTIINVDTTSRIFEWELK
jgi:hypothetical protein